MRKAAIQSILLLLLAAPISAQSAEYQTWANWERRMERAFENFTPRKLPGRPMGIIVPADPRTDILSMTAYGYEVLRLPKSGTLLILMAAPEGYDFNGIVMPAMDKLATTFGDFSVDSDLRSALLTADFPIYVDDRPFAPTLPETLLTQLAAAKFAVRGGSAHLRFLPVLVKFSDINYQSKDLGPYIAEAIRDLGVANDVLIVVAGDLTQAAAPPALVETDNAWLTAIRNLDVDALVALKENAGESYRTPHIDAVALGVLAIRWLGADHGEILAYSNSAQLVLTKDKSKPLSFVVAGFASEAPFPPDIPHIDRDKIVETFDALFRSDILSLVRQTVASTIDPTAAKPPALPQKEAGKEWPVYVSIYDAEGNLAGQAGTHEGILPLEEALRQHTFAAVREAGPAMTKSNMGDYIVEVSIPYGFSPVRTPEDLIPLLNGIVVSRDRKSLAYHPNAWRRYPHAHQILGAICHQLGLRPWAYATEEATIRSFRVLSFNEKEPFQSLDKDKKSSGGDAGADVPYDDGALDAAFPF